MQDLFAARIGLADDITEVLLGHLIVLICLCLSAHEFLVQFLVADKFIIIWLRPSQAAILELIPKLALGLKPNIFEVDERLVFLLGFAAGLILIEAAGFVH